jgi:hypothetical protein
VLLIVLSFASWGKKKDVTTLTRGRNFTGIPNNWRGANIDTELPRRSLGNAEGGRRCGKKINNQPDKSADISFSTAEIGLPLTPRLGVGMFLSL